MLTRALVTTRLSSVTMNSAIETIARVRPLRLEIDGCITTPY